jgi:hypothetical protein
VLLLANAIAELADSPPWSNGKWFWFARGFKYKNHHIEALKHSQRVFERKVLRTSFIFARFGAYEEHSLTAQFVQ